jgi:MSHA biogenesis protein MshN
MGLINKIRSGLNKRGENALPGGSAIQFVLAQKKWGKAALIGGIVLVCAAGWMALGSRHKIAAPASVAQTSVKSISVPQVTSPPIAASGVKISQAIAASQPVAVVTREVPSKESAQKENGQKMGAAALRPSSELDVSPPAKPLATASRHKHHETASTSAPDAESAASDNESWAAPVPEGGVNKKIKPLSAQQQADNEFRRANGLMQQGHIDEALAGYEAALQLDAGHEAARQAMAVLLLQNKRNADAERVLQEGLKLNIKNSSFAMLLARIQVDRDASWSALLVLQKTLPYAERQPDYQAFVAALLQRLNRHKEAVMHYQAAVQLSPNSGVWQMGLGISLQALQRNEEARVAFKRALETHTLNDDLQTYVKQQLKAL